MSADKKSLKGTKTERNLLTSFAGESQARNRYTYFASHARKQGCMQISAIFAETADQEKEHAKRMFKFLQGGTAEICAAFPAGIIGSVAENLAAAAAGEHEEHTQLYPGFAQVAQEEGFNDVAAMYRAIAVAEQRHEQRYLKLKANMDADNVFKSDQQQRWVCRNCGYVHTGTAAPGACAACLHPQAYFELEAKNY